MQDFKFPPDKSYESFTISKLAAPPAAGVLEHGDELVVQDEVVGVAD